MDGFWFALFNETSIVKDWMNLTTVFQDWEPPPACSDVPGRQTYKHCYHNAPWFKGNFTLPNPKDAFVSPAGNTTNNIGGVEETCFAALMDLVYNQMDTELDDVLAVCGLAIMQMQQDASNMGQVMAVGKQLKDEADKLGEEEQQEARKEVIELSIMAALTVLPFVGKAATEI